MRLIRILPIGVATVVMSLLGGPTIAARQAVADPQVLSSGNLDDSAASSEYWTPKRMADAEPADLTLPGAPIGAPEPSITPGPAVTVAPSAPDGAAGGNDAPETQVVPNQLAATRVPKPYTNAPDRMNGKVFFTAASGHDFVCSGTTVSSENKSVVWTAGHCVHGGKRSRYHRHWIFVPAYSSGAPRSRPYGTWTARELATSAEWAKHSDLRQDFGAAVVNRRNGQRLTSRTGGQGIAFNLPRDQAWSAFGYPKDPPFNGLLQYRCDSATLGAGEPRGAGEPTIQIRCNMTGGASGGGWLVNLQAGHGQLNGNTSYSFSDRNRNLFGPYFGNEAMGLYNAVRNRPA